VNHTRFPKEDHLPDWARRDNKVTMGDRVEWETEKLLHSILFFLLLFHFLTDYEISAKKMSLQKLFLSEDLDQCLKPLLHSRHTWGIFHGMPELE